MVHASSTVCWHRWLTDTRNANTAALQPEHPVALSGDNDRVYQGQVSSSMHRQMSGARNSRHISWNISLGPLHDQCDTCQTWHDDSQSTDRTITIRIIRILSRKEQRNTYTRKTKSNCITQLEQHLHWFWRSVGKLVLSEHSDNIVEYAYGYHLNISPRWYQGLNCTSKCPLVSCCINQILQVLKNI